MEVPSQCSHQLTQQFALRTEVVVHDPDGHAGTNRDLRYRRLLESGFTGFCESGLENTGSSAVRAGIFATWANGVVGSC